MNNGTKGNARRSRKQLENGYSETAAEARQKRPEFITIDGVTYRFQLTPVAAGQWRKNTTWHCDTPDGIVATKTDFYSGVGKIRLTMVVKLPTSNS